MAEEGQVIEVHSVEAWNEQILKGNDSNKLVCCGHYKVSQHSLSSLTNAHIILFKRSNIIMLNPSHIFYSIKLFIYLSPSSFKQVLKGNHIDRLQLIVLLLAVVHAVSLPHFSQNWLKSGQMSPSLLKVDVDELNVSISQLRSFLIVIF